jgi:hypothetical protein
VNGPASHHGRRRPFSVRDHPVARFVCADAPLLVSVQQKNTNNRMALQFVQYLDCRTFESRFA